MVLSGGRKLRNDGAFGHQHGDWRHLRHGWGRRRRERDAAGSCGAAGDNDVGCGLDPFARIGEAGICAYGPDEAGGSDDFNVVGAFDDVFEGETNVPAALSEEASGMGMAVERAPIREIKLLGYKFRTDPVEKGFLDSVALGVFADGAFAAVTFEGGRASGGIHG